jgi:energy-coupling factor transporter transmembrane protein EcfT
MMFIFLSKKIKKERDENYIPPCLPCMALNSPTTPIIMTATTTIPTTASSPDEFVNTVRTSSTEPFISSVALSELLMTAPTSLLTIKAIIKTTDDISNATNANGIRFRIANPFLVFINYTPQSS